MEKFITEEQILTLTNNQKRKEFIKTWPEWPVLAAVLTLKLVVRQVILPDRQRIVSLEYAKTPSELFRYCYFQRLGLTDGISPFNDTSDNLVIDLLKDLRMKIMNQRKKGHTNGNT